MYAAPAPAGNGIHCVAVGGVRLGVGGGAGGGGGWPFGFKHQRSVKS